MRRCSIGLGLLLAACAAPPPKGPPSTATAALYARLDADVQRFAAARAAMGRGNAEQAVADAAQALTDLREAAQQCPTTRGCDAARFWAAFDELLRADLADATAPARDGVDQPPGAAEDAVGESSPVLAALPEASRSLALLKGRDLGEVIAVNEPIKVAIEQWLTQYRPNLMKAYENYQYLRERMWPEYRKAGLPEALLFGILAQESGGKVHAVSRSGASGPLQFMSTTAARFGLGVVDGFDQRFDPTLAARANAAYINEQLGVFNDNLELALAAYNGGEGAIQRLAQRQNATSFWSPPFYAALSAETREYVPMVLAAAWLFLHPERYHLRFPKLDARLAEISLQRPASLDELTICLGQDGNADGWFRTLRNLNPALDPRQRLPVGTRLAVPEPVAAAYPKSCIAGKWVELAADLHAAALPTVAERVTRSYTVKRGDTLAGIARKTGCASSTEELARLNHLKPPHYPLKVGQDLRLICGRN
jgi:membrane-bound lytic murein transglycosylase D